MAPLKTQPRVADVLAFIDAIEHPRKRADAHAVVTMMRDITGEEPVLWGDRLIGFGSFHCRRNSGSQGSWPLTAFAPGKQRMTIHIMPGFSDYQPLLARLGKFRTGRSCLYINKLSDVDDSTLRELIAQSVADLRERYG